MSGVAKNYMIAAAELILLKNQLKNMEFYILNSINSITSHTSRKRQNTNVCIQTMIFDMTEEWLCIAEWVSKR